MEEARRRLLEHEQLLENYKRKYAGELPDQVQGNLQAIQSAQLRLQAVTESINRDRDRRLMLERQIADLQGSTDVVVSSPAIDPTAPVTPLSNSMPRRKAAGIWRRATPRNIQMSSPRSAPSEKSRRS